MLPTSDQYLVLLERLPTSPTDTMSRLLESLSYSINFMSVLGMLNDTILSTDGSGLSVHQSEAANPLEERLISLRKFLVLYGALRSVLGEDDVLEIAELYHLAPPTYVERRCKRESWGSTEVVHARKDAFTSLKSFKYVQLYDDYSLSPVKPIRIFGGL